MRTGWDLSTATGKKACWAALEEELPELVVRSPICAPFSVLQGLNADSEKKREALRVGLDHLRFSIAVYNWQLGRGKLFLHEHPWSASSWQLECMKKLRVCAGGETRAVRLAHVRAERAAPGPTRLGETRSAEGNRMAHQHGGAGRGAEREVLR